MKKKFFFLSLIAACLLVAQSCCYDEYEHGVLSFRCNEYVMAILKSSIVGGSSWRDPIGFQAGVNFPVMNISEPLALRAGAVISLQGANWQEGSLEGKTSLWYAYIPVVLRYKHSSGFYGEAGLQPGFLLSATDKYEGTSENYMDEMNKFDLSVPLAIGYKFNNNIGVNLKVIPGITDITKDKDEKDRNFVFGLGVTYTFNVKK